MMGNMLSLMSIMSLPLAVRAYDGFGNWYFDNVDSILDPCPILVRRSTVVLTLCLVVHDLAMLAKARLSEALRPWKR